MFGEVRFPGEAGATAPFAVGVRAHVSGFGAILLSVDFPLVTEQTVGVGEYCVPISEVKYPVWVSRRLVFF